MIGMDNETIMKFDQWVRNGLELFNKEIRGFIYSFLYKLSYLTYRPDRKIIVELLTNLEIIKNTNIKEITTASIAGFDELIEEIKDNIILKNYWATFYSMETLAERIVDSIIERENGLLKKDSERIKDIKKRIKKGHLFLMKKIDYLNIIKEYYNTKDLEILIAIVDLLRLMRNSFMFHVTSYDEYSFVYDMKEIHKKEHLLKELIGLIKEKIDNVLALIPNKFSGRRILEFYSKDFQELINYYKKHKSTKKTFISNFFIYSDLPKKFAEISYVFILFFGKKDLNLFNV